MTFVAEGLPAGANWSITLNGSAQNSTGTTIVFESPNGSYPVEIGAPSGYGAERISGPAAPSQHSVDIVGPSTFEVSFGPLEPLEFDETGLAPLESVWGITLRSGYGSAGPPTVTPSQYLGFPERSSGVAYDSGTGEMVVAIDTLSTIPFPTQPRLGEFGFLAEFSARTHVLDGLVPFYGAPGAITYDPAKAETFVAGGAPFQPRFLSVISDDSNTTVANLSVAAEGLAYDPQAGELFASAVESANGSLVVINDTTLTVIHELPLPAVPSGIVYDPGRDEVFVADGTNVSVFTASGAPQLEDTVRLPSTVFALAYDPARNEVFATDGANVSVISDRNDSVLATVALGSYVTGVAYDPDQAELFAADGGNVSVLSDTNDTVLATVALPTGFTSEGATFDPVAEDTILGTSAEGNLENVSVDAIGGLPDRVLAEYDFNNQTIGSLNLTVPPGTYTFSVDPVPSYAATPPSGAVTVEAHRVHQTITFVPLTYSVVFRADGLPLGTTWSVTLGGTTETTTNGTIVFLVPGGVDPFTVTPAPGYLASPSSGFVVVNGSGAFVQIDLTAVGPPGLGVGWLGLPAYDGVVLLIGVGSAVCVVVGSRRLPTGRRGNAGAPPRSSPSVEEGRGRP